MPKLIDELFRDADSVDVDELPPAWPIDNVDDPGEERLLLVASDDDKPGQDPVGFGGSIEEGPDVARVVNLADVGREGNPRAQLVGHGLLLTSSSDRGDGSARGGRGPAGHLVEPVGHTALLAGHEVAVAVEREGRRGVSEHPL